MMQDSEIAALVEDVTCLVGQSTGQPVSRGMQCNVCGRLFSTWAGVRAHKRVHSKKKLYQCPLCARKLASASRAIRHIRRVHVDRK